MRNVHDYRHGYLSKYQHGADVGPYIVVGNYPEGNPDPCAPYILLKCKEHNHIIVWKKRDCNQVKRSGKCKCFGHRHKFRKDYNEEFEARRLLVRSGRARSSVNNARPAFICTVGH